MGNSESQHDTPDFACISTPYQFRTHDAWPNPGRTCLLATNELAREGQSHTAGSVCKGPDEALFCRNLASAERAGCMRHNGARQDTIVLIRLAYRYEGEWRNGKKEGKGTYKYAGGGEYIGSVTLPST